MDLKHQIECGLGEYIEKKHGNSWNFSNIDEAGGGEEVSRMTQFAFLVS